MRIGDATAVKAGQSVVCLFFAQRYARGKAGWGWAWTSRRARLLTAGFYTGLAALSAVQAVALEEQRKRNEVNKAEILKRVLGYVEQP